MLYSEIRHEIQSGDIITTSNENWDSLANLESQVVRAVTQSEFSHCAVAWVVANRVFVIESVVPLVRIKPLSNFDNFYWIPTPDFPMTEAELEYGLSKVGTESYSKWDAVLAQFNLLDIAADDSWQCSELVIAMRRLSQLELGEKATPSAVVKEALKRGYKLTYVTRE